MNSYPQQPTPAPAQIELPPDFPEIPADILERFPSAVEWQARLNEFWTRTNQALQQAQTQLAAQVNSTVVYSVDRFLIYARNGIPEPMFALDSTGVKLGDTLVVSTAGRKVFIGVGEYENANTPFYIDTLGRFSLGANLSWDPDTSTLNITGTITADSGSIGGFDIGTDYIRDTADTFGLASTVTGGNDVRIWSGSTFAARATAPFRIYEDGTITVGSGASYQYNNVRMISGITATNNFFFGPAGNFTMSGASNVAIGTDALIADTTGYRNTAIGIESLKANTTGYQNTAIGYQAMLVNTSGFYNVAIGYGILTANTSGYSNVAVGYRCMETNTTGYQNVAFGTQALMGNTTGHWNVALGYRALEVNTTGSLNLAVGGGVTGGPLFRNTTGSANIAMGDGTLYENTTGGYNIGIGVNALQNTTAGIFNIAIGNSALLNFNDAGFGAGCNTAIGSATGLGIVTGSGNTILGANVSGLAAGLTNNIILAIGTGAIKARFDGTNWTFSGGITADSYTGGAISGTTGTFSGLISSTKTGALFGGTGATTDAKFFVMSNTGNDGSYWGIENSVGGIFGATAYDTAFLTAAGTGFSFIVNAGVNARITSTGINSTVIGATTPAAGSFTTLAASGNFGVNGSGPIAKPTVTGSRGGNAALASLLTALANYGLITDGTSA